MKVRTCGSIALLLILLSWLPAAAQTCPVQKIGAGPDIPCNVKVNGVALVPNVAVNVPDQFPGTNTVQAVWDTNTPQTSVVCVDYNVNGYSSPTCQRIEHDDTLVTHHVLTLHNFMPGKATALNIAGVQQAGVASGSWFGVAGDRYSQYASVTPSGNQQASAYQVTLATPAAGTPQWTAYVKGPPQMDQGRAMFLDILPMLQSGSIPNYLGALSIAIDGQNCAAAVPATCSGFSTLIADSGAEHLSSVPYGNYGAAVSKTADLAGKFYVSGCQTAYCFSQPGILWFIEATNATVGHHTADIQLSGADSTQKLWGNTVALHYEFDVIAVPTFQPSSAAPPAFTSAGPFNAVIRQAINGQPEHNLTFGYQAAQNASLTLPGIYNTDNFSPTQTAYFPYDVFNYNGAVVCANFARWAQAIAQSGIAFQPNHFYNAGDYFWDGSNVEVARVQGTSGSSFAPGSVGAVTTSGGVTFDNDGNQAYWLQQFQRVVQLMKDWLVEGLPRTVSEEWNIMLERDVFLDYLMTGDVTTDNCDGSGHCVGKDLKGLKYALYPMVPAPPGMTLTSQPPMWSGKFVQNGTWRAQPYHTELIDNVEFATGQKVMNGGFDAAERRLDIMIQGMREMENNNPVVSATNPYPAALSTPNFDIALAVKAAVWHCVKQVNTGGSCDGRIPVEIGKILDWFFANQWNKMGTNYSAPYTTWFWPAGPRKDYTGNDDSNFAANEQLNNLLAPFVAWYARYTGPGCTFPTSGLDCFQVANSMAMHSLDQGFWNDKSLNQVFQGWYNLVMWMSGQKPVTWIDTLPDAKLSAPIPDKMEPYPNGEWPAKPSYTTAAGGLVTVTWNQGKKAADTFIRYALKGSLTASSPLVDCGPNSYVGPDTTWVANCNLSGVANGIYDYALGATDASGNSSLSSSCPTCNGQTNWNFTQQNGGSGGPTLGLNASPSSLSIQQGNNSTATITSSIAGGFNSNVSLSVSGAPTGTTASLAPATLVAPGSGSATLTIAVGSTTPAGNYSLTVTGSGGGLSAKAVVSLTVTAQLQSGPTITTTSLLPATQGQPYSATFTEKGGVAPFTWALAGLPPAGMKWDASSGTLSGTPTGSGTVQLSVTCTDAQKLGDSVTIPLVINPAQTGGNLAIEPVDPTQLVATVGSPYKLQLSATNYQLPITWKVIAGQLPANTNLSALLGTISGTPSAPGAAEFTVQVTDGSKATATVDLTIAVNGASGSGKPVFALSPVLIVWDNKPYKLQLVPTGGLAPYSFQATNLPNGLTLDPVTGILQGTLTTPLVQQATITITDANKQSVSHTTDVVSLPQIPGSVN